MEGPKSFETKPQKVETTEAILESIEQAKEVYQELLKYNGAEIIGDGAIDAHKAAEALATELKELLQTISAKDCIENGLPYHPNDTKPESKKTAFPLVPDYPTPAGSNYSLPKAA